MKTRIRMIATAFAASVAAAAFAEDPFIQSDGSQGFVTGHCLGPNTKIELDCQLTDVEANKGHRLIGIYLVEGSSTPAFSIYVGTSGGVDKFSLETLNGEGARAANNNYTADTERHVFVVDFSAATDHFKIFTDGAEVYASGSAYTSFPDTESALPIGLFGCNSKNAGVAYRSKMKVYGLKIYEAGELMKDFVPGERGGVLGFWESKSGKFSTTTNPEGLGSDRVASVSLNSANYVKVKENTGPLAGTWSLAGITAWNGTEQTRFAVASNRVYAAANAAAAVGELPAGNYVQQLSVFNQWDGTRTRSYRVQLAQPVGDSNIYARVTAVTVSQPGVNLADCPDPREYKDDSTKIEASYTAAADLEAFPVTKLRFKRQDGYIQSAGARDACVNTGYKPGPNTRIEFDYEFTSLDYTNVRAELFGSYAGSSLVGGYVYIDRDNRYLYYNFSTTTTKSNNHYQNVKAHPADLSRHCVVVDYSTKSFEVWTDGTNDCRKTLAEDLHGESSRFPMSIIGSNSKMQYPHTANPPKIKVYGCRIYEAGALVKNFIPCVRGGITGFKERCAGVFVTSENVASLTAGGDIWEDPDDPYLQLDNPIGAAVVGETLYCTPNDRVDPDTRIEFDYALMAESPLTENGMLFTSYGSKNMSVYTSGGHYAFTINGTDYYRTSEVGDIQYMFTTNAYGIRRTVVLDKNSIRFVTAGYTNAVKTVTSALSATNNSFMIANRGTDSKDRPMPMRVYGYSIYTNGVLQKKYVPYVTNGVPGLLEVIHDNWSFPYTYRGTGQGENGQYTRRLVGKIGGNYACVDGSDEAYLEFPGTGGGIDTGYRVTPDSCVEADIAIYNTYKLVNGSEVLLSQDNSDFPVHLRARNDDHFHWVCGGGNASVDSGVVMGDNAARRANERRVYKFDCKNRLVTFTAENGSTNIYSAAMSVGDDHGEDVAHTLVVGADNAYIRLYGLKISENGVERRNYVQCVRDGSSGLYETHTRAFFPLAGGVVSGKGSRNADEVVFRPPASNYIGRIGKRLTCLAPGATSYEWYEDGVLQGETSSTLTLGYARDEPKVREYTVVPVYDVFCEKVRGAAVTTSVEYIMPGLLFMLQ